MSLHQSLKEKTESFMVSQQEENQRWAAAGRAGCVAERPPADSGPMHRPVLKIFIVYESDLNRDRAQFMREELSRRLGLSFTFSVSWWSLKSLGNSEIRKAAARSVAEADIICFSLLSGGELPQNVTKWIEKGLFERKTNKLCLLALVETGGMVVPRLSRAEIYLSHLSSAAGVDCLCYSDSIPIARSIRSKPQERPLGFSSRRRLARSIGRESLQP
jgi:hypothetical protein